MYVCMYVCMYVYIYTYIHYRSNREASSKPTCLCFFAANTYFCQMFGGQEVGAQLQFELYPEMQHRNSGSFGVWEVDLPRR